MVKICPKAFFALWAVLILSSAYAQQPPPPQPPPPGGPHPPGYHEGMGMQGGRGPRGPFPQDWEDKDLRELIDTVRMYRLSKVLELSDEQTVMLMRRYDDFKKQIASIWEKRGKTMELLRQKVESNAPESEIEEVLNSLVQLEEESFRAKNELIQKTGEGLTIRQRAKMLLFLQDFERDMRRLLEKAREFQGADKEQAREQLKKRIKEWQEPPVKKDASAPAKEAPAPK